MPTPLQPATNESYTIEDNRVLVSNILETVAGWSQIILGGGCSSQGNTLVIIRVHYYLFSQEH